MRRILAVARVELLRLRRSRISLTLLLLVPALQVLLFGTAIKPGDHRVSVVVAAPDAASAARVAALLADAPGLRIAAHDLKPGEAAAQVRAGRALIGIEVPRLLGFARLSETQQPIVAVVDAANAGLTGAAVARLEAAYWRAVAVPGGPRSTVPALRIEKLYNPQSRADWTFLPSLIGVTVMIAMIMLGALGLARERETGTWEALLTLPIGPGEALAGRLLPYALIGTLQGMAVLAIGVWLFDLPVRGSITGLLLLLPLFAAAHVALGHVIAARAATQLAALQGAVAFYLPAMLLSGFLYPFETLPGWARDIGNVFPLTHFIRAAQAATLRGGDIGAVLAHGIPIAGFLLAMVAVGRFAQTRRLD